MNEPSQDPHLAAVGADVAPPQQAHDWSPFPPAQVRSRWRARIAAVRRPVGSFALPAVAVTATTYFADLLPREDSAMAFGLTALVVVYDTVIAVCRTWEKVRGGPERPVLADGRTDDSARHGLGPRRAV
ncbi:hypothetical protein [Streptomyces sp. DSM 40750]|uniref:hypothetical protein n=1 Tax=Streptomyces sp. DSM 40750 TaxID=2801030 RepID=UPI00214BEE6A|nr:hypothetical protein [Streptomyces sp. DSM 40750]UUU25531.1 hypothetical protein JIX55_37725 [Streptomyces sp. DSM 40750]